MEKGKELDDHVNKLLDELKERLNRCSKGGLKREGASCSLNNNCTYPKCLNFK